MVGVGGVTHYFDRDVLTRLPHMTNWQISEVIPFAWKSTLIQERLAS
jgi:hypothetical protein